MCAQKFPGLICKPIAAQFADPSLIVLFAFEQTTDGLRIVAERHYRLVDADELSNERNRCLSDAARVAATFLGHYCIFPCLLEC